MDRGKLTASLNEDWKENRRWKNVHRPYAPDKAVDLYGSLLPEYPHARYAAERLWDLLHGKARNGYVNTLGALTGMQAQQYARAGLQALYISGWQAAADANTAETTYPDLALYPVNTVPTLVRRIARAQQQADKIQWARRVLPGDDGYVDFLLPMVADGDAPSSPLNAFELMKAMIEAGAAGVHFEDQLGGEKKCGHLGGKVLIPTRMAEKNLVAARLAADSYRVPTIIVARTDADSATLLTSDIDPRDQPFITGRRDANGFYEVQNGIESAIARAKAYGRYADMIWCETSTPDVGYAREFAEEFFLEHPGKLLAYNCSPSFNWRRNLDLGEIAAFQAQLAEYGYVFQFVTLAGIHSNNYHSFKLARAYRDHGMAAYSELQQEEFLARELGYTFAAHQQEVGTGLYDQIRQTIEGSEVKTTALAGSTEAAQF